MNLFVHRPPKQENESGFSVLTILIAASALALLMGAGLSTFNAQIGMDARDRRGLTINDLKSRIEILFAHNHLCQLNLRSSSFGSTISAALSRSSQGRVAVHDPNNSHPGSSHQGSLYRPGDIVDGVEIEQIRFVGLNGELPFETPIPTTSSYLVHLEFQFKETSEFRRRPLRIPFYFATANGRFTDCSVTMIVLPDTQPPMTLENFICQSLPAGELREGGSAEDYVYDPESRVCINQTVTI